MYMCIVTSPRIQAVYGLWYSDGSITPGPVKISKSTYSLNSRAIHYDV